MVYYVHLKNGLGDQMLDVIGANVVAKLHDDILMIHWKTHTQHFFFGNAVYSDKLFDIENIVNENETKCTNDDEPKFEIDIPAPSASTAPAFIFQKYNDIVDINRIKDLYLHFCNNIKPCSELNEHISDIHIDYGIHLRCSDKIIYDKNHKSGIDCNINEYTDLIKKLKEFVHDKIEDGTSFYVCSEDSNVELDFKRWLDETAKHKNKTIQIINKTKIHGISDHTGYDAVYDLFMLSKCKSFISGTKYSTFGILACLLSHNKKYICFVDDISTTLLYPWLICFNEIINNNNLIHNIVYNHSDDTQIQLWHQHEITIRNV